MATVFEIQKALEKYFPFTDAESWDNSGILVESSKNVERVIVALDATCDVIKEAKKLNAQLIITHHPVIFHPLKALCENEPAVLALKNGIAIISAHTNYDISEYGADASLSKALSDKAGFCAESILDITRCEPIVHGFGRIGSVNRNFSCEEFALILKDIFACDSLCYVESSNMIRKIAFCSGAGGEYLEKVISLGCDAFITSDVKHSAFITASNANIALFTPTHYQMEKPAMKNISALLSQSFQDIEILLSQSEKEPVKVI